MYIQQEKGNPNIEKKMDLRLSPLNRNGPVQFDWRTIRRAKRALPHLI